MSPRLLLAQNHMVLLSYSPGQWPKWKCKSESLHKACELYRWKFANTVLMHHTAGDVQMWGQMWTCTSGKFKQLV